MIVQEIETELLERMCTEIIGIDTNNYDQIGNKVMHTLNQVLIDNRHRMETMKEEAEVNALIEAVTKQLFKHSI